MDVINITNDSTVALSPVVVVLQLILEGVEPLQIGVGDAGFYLVPAAPEQSL